jgi:hypothetical protein
MENKEVRAPKTPQGDRVVLMYPGNQLKAQVRPIEETMSASQVLRETFFSAH